jgi:hypothetical protein
VLFPEQGNPSIAISGALDASFHLGNRFVDRRSFRDHIEALNETLLTLEVRNLP